MSSLMLGRSPKGQGTALSDGAVPSAKVSYGLAGQVHAAIRGDDLLLLSIASGQYFCVPAAGAGLRLKDGSNEVAIQDHDLAEVLVSGGFIEALSTPSPRPPSPGHVRRDAQLSPYRLDPWATVRLTAAATISAAVGFYGRSFAHLVAAAGARSGLGHTDLAQSEKVAGRFLAALPWIPSQGDCLYRSFVLHALLSREGLNAAWVFGVQTWPFEAHCWLQVEDVVLDDTCDHVSGFTPILVV